MTPRSISSPVRPRSLTYGVVAAALAVVPLTVLGTGTTAVAQPSAFVPADGSHLVTVTYTAVGHQEMFRVPDGVSSLKVRAIGGSGGDAASDIEPGLSKGGLGSVVTGTLTVTPGLMLAVRVGGDGADASGNGAGGFNGGGDGGAANMVGAGGGGATDLRACDTSCTELTTPLLVAGGGGGAGLTQGPDIVAGGNAGQAGEDYSGVRGTVHGGTPGNGVEPGVGGASDDEFDRISSGGTGVDGTGGIGGGRTGPDAVPDTTFAFRGAGGGGGGRYGGGGGGDNRYYGAGGGGGSSLVPDGGTTDLADEGVAGELAITYDLGPVTQLQVNVQDATIPASGRATTTVSAQAKTAGGQPVAGLDVSFVSSDPGQAFGPVTDEGDGTYSATLNGSTTIGSASITATAQGDDNDLLGEAGVTQVAYAAPGLTSTLSSSTAPRAGFYGTPVTVSFACTGSRPVTCPAPVTLRADGRNQKIARTITDDQGVSASTTVTVSIDGTKPTVKVTGAKNGATYAAVRKLTCKASDKLSGVKSCKVTTTRKRTAKGVLVKWVGTAFDKAGNSSVTKGSYTIRKR